MCNIPYTRSRQPKTNDTAANDNRHNGLVVADVTITQCSKVDLFSSCKLNSELWHCVDKNLYLNKAWVSSAYVYVQQKKEDLTADDRVVIDVKVGGRVPDTIPKEQANVKWESRPGGVWILRSALLR
ncbi:hypothetical protein F5Y18DRAFT_231090 [Xylariaceae sp. FL1019]|nr:hypothetical protein F5Y18DRAFT_231090 [Xylariaceae sp. FL1019]